MSPSPTEVQQFYSGSTIFLTGATGLVGKIILEKLLRVCDVEKIYILLRRKKEKDESLRAKETLDGPVFKDLKETNPTVFEKVVVMKGDISKPNLGLSIADRDLIIREVNTFINCAASLNFTKSLSTAIRSNLMSSRTVLDLAREARNLQSVVHVSTAFSHCPRTEIDEVNYEPSGMKGAEIIELLEKLGDDVFDKRQSEFLGDWPNTYSFSKALTEDLLWDEGKEMPLAIVRPTIIIGTEREPISGFIDNFYGPQGLYAATSVGLLRVGIAKTDYAVDVIPADYVGNCIICAAWEVAQGCETKFYNIGSTSQNGVTWGDIRDVHDNFSEPTLKMIWYPFVVSTSCVYWYAILSFFLEIVPAHIIDFILLCSGKEQLLVKSTAKAHEFIRSMRYFSLREWRWGDKNVRKLLCKLSVEDQEMFHFDTTRLDFEELLPKCMTGCRELLLNDPLETLPEARRKYEKLKIYHYTSVTVLLIITYFMLRYFIKMFVTNYNHN